jgi:holo-[acyl-carrier-protein] synthase
MRSSERELAGIGVDIVELERVKQIRFLPRFAEYFLTPNEVENFQKIADPVSFIASRFAAKEAVIKAFPGFIKPHAFEIVKYGVKPEVRFLSPDVDRCYETAVSISHGTEYAAGFAVIRER